MLSAVHKKVFRTLLRFKVQCSFLFVLLTLIQLASGWPVQAAAMLVPATVAPVDETEPVPHAGDAADDIAVWVHPSDPAKSLVIGTEKQGGLLVYNLRGEQTQYLQDGGMNNVDVHYNFPFAEGRVDLVAASNRVNRSVDLYRVRLDTGSETAALLKVGSIQTMLADYAYGLCMYHSPVSGKYYVFVNTYVGAVEQWELSSTASAVTGTRVRNFEVRSRFSSSATPIEGCVADHELGYLYIGAEVEGIWKYGAEPTSGTARTLVAETASGGPLKSNVEGITIYYGGNGTGYLLASSQGNDSFVVYRREGNNEFVTAFAIGAGNGIDSVQDTDGIDVTNVNLGSAYPQGLFVVQDGDNSPGNQNFKLVPWQGIAASAPVPLTIDISWNPRGGADTARVFIPMILNEAAPPQD